MGTIIALVALALAIVNLVHTTHVGGKVSGILQAAEKAVGGGGGSAPAGGTSRDDIKTT